MVGKAMFTCGLLVPVLALTSGPSPDARIESVPAVPTTAVELPNVTTSPDAMDCSFAIRASNNLSFDVWVDLYSSRLNNGGWGVFGGYKPLEIQNHRIASGKSMDRRYTASGSCSKDRGWEFAVRIGRTDGQKIYKYIKKTTRYDTDRTIDLGKSSTWGL
jgi:hypothetical protein